MKTPEQIAAELVDQFSWSSNVMRDGRLVGQQYIVAEAIARAIASERVRAQTLTSALCRAMTALAGLTSRRLQPNGPKAKYAFKAGMIALEETR